MEIRPEPDQPDLTLQLPRDVYYQLIQTLRASLPPPVTDTSEDRARCDNAAMAHVASMLPANADEANLAALSVAASAQALDSLRLARTFPAESAPALKCTAQANSMMRQARAFRSLLLRVQALRQKREADNATLDQATWIEHCAVSLMADALGRSPPAPVAEPPPVPAPRIPEPAQADEPQADPTAAAEEYAVTYPQRAALIRRLGRVPDNPTFGPPDAVLVRALVTGRTATLLALDRQMTETCTA